MAELFPSMMPAEILKGYYGMQDVINQSEQGGLKSQLMNLDVAREQAAQQELQAGAPLREQQRGLQMEQVQGQRQQLPFTQQRDLALAKAAADPKRLATEIESGNLKAATDQRTQQMRKTADEMDSLVQGFGPVLEAMGRNDYEEQNSAWESFFKLQERNGVDTREMRVTPRDQLIPQLGQQYNQALNTAPAIRERIKADEAHMRKLEEIAAAERARAAAARERALATNKPVNSMPAVVSRIMDQYTKDPSGITKEQASTAIEWIESNMSQSERDEYEVLWNDAERQSFHRNRGKRLRERFGPLYEKLGGNRAPAEVTRRQQFDAQGRPVK